MINLNCHPERSEGSQAEDPSVVALPQDDALENRRI